jgi:hypothetical protein
MGKPIKKDVAASVRQRLLNLSHESGEDFNLVLTRYGLERMLYRLGQSVWRDQFLLKGAMLFAFWIEDRHRPTRDADFLSFIDAEIDKIVDIFQSLCKVITGNDGVTFNPDSVQAREIRENNVYEGIRVRLEGELSGAKINLQFDIGFGDAVTPGPVEIIYPTLLDMEAPNLKVYPVFTVIAEKFEALVKLGMTNSRMKDFYDLRAIAKKIDLDGEILADAISATFRRRKTEIPEHTPLVLTEEYYNDETKKKQWFAFIRNNQIKEAPELNELMGSLECFLMPPVVAIKEGKQFMATWHADKGWEGKGSDRVGLA